MYIYIIIYIYYIYIYIYLLYVYIYISICIPTNPGSSRTFRRIRLRCLTTWREKASSVGSWYVLQNLLSLLALLVQKYEHCSVALTALPTFGSRL